MTSSEEGEEGEEWESEHHTKDDAAPEHISQTGHQSSPQMNSSSDPKLETIDRTSKDQNTDERYIENYYKEWKNTDFDGVDQH